MVQYMWRSMSSFSFACHGCWTHSSSGRHQWSSHVVGNGSVNSYFNDSVGLFATEITYGINFKFLESNSTMIMFRLVWILLILVPGTLVMYGMWKVASGDHHLSLGFDAMRLGSGERILLGFQFGAPWLPIFYNTEEIMLVLLLMDWFIVRDWATVASAELCLHIQHHHSFGAHYAIAGWWQRFILFVPTSQVDSKQKS